MPILLAATLFQMIICEGRPVACIATMFILVTYKKKRLAHNNERGLFMRYAHIAMLGDRITEA